MYHWLRKFSDFGIWEGKTASINGPGRTISIGLVVWVGLFFAWSKEEGVLTPGVVQPTLPARRAPLMLLKQATVRNVSRALKEINAFEIEGDFKPKARQALKEILEKRLGPVICEAI
jgi:hypothetical protein